MEPLTLPAIDCPFAADFETTEHPHAREATEELLDLLHHIDPDLPGSVIRRGVPIEAILTRCWLGTSKSALLAGLMGSVHFFLHDDWVEERDDTGRLVRTRDELLAHYDSAHRILGGGSPLPGDLSLAHLLYLFRRQVIEVSPHPDIRSLALSVEQYLAAHVWELDIARQGRVPSLSTYVPMRLYTGGTLPFFELDLHLYGLAVPARIREHPVVKHLCETAANLAIWVNDLYSINKERREGSAINLVAVLRAERSCSWPEAVDAATAMIHQATEAYLDVRGRLPDLGIDVSGDLEAWLSRVEAYMALTLINTPRTPRYGAH
ncbi:terpene synthase family protein [Streptomyces sp. NPDC127051]|uniref:terpene synthase family protein n=1 Tax=Streptomyces sp. NPDC127051 TaxID=3347119 RepID=UPI00364EA340